MYRFQWEPPKAWVDSLRLIAPPTHEYTAPPNQMATAHALKSRKYVDDLSWLHLEFESGDVWQPIQRWVVWVMRPWGSVPRYHFNALYGPNPRTDAYYDETLEKFVGPYVSDIDRLTWELFQKTGCYGTRYWVIQGDKGGHLRELTHSQKKLLKTKTGKWEDVPMMGDLPYADYDNRVFTQLLFYDRYRTWKQSRDYTGRTFQDLSNEEKEEARTANRAMMQFLFNQIDQRCDEYRQDLRNAISRAPVLPGVKSTTDFEQLQESYINNTH